jgi:hypothetical protein
MADNGVIESLDPAAADYSVAVRSLCEFTARTGDLTSRFTPAPSAQQGMAGHVTVAGRRGAEYEREVPLRGRYGMLNRSWSRRRLRCRAQSARGVQDPPR